MKLIKVFYKTTTGKEPEYKTKDASGVDLAANIKQSVRLNPGERALIPTGIYLQIPHGYEGQIRPRSGLAMNNGVTVLNTPGTIDADYRGEIMVILINLDSRHYYIVTNGERIAQLVFAPVVKASFCQREFLNKTGRGCRGMGSTGV